MTHGVDAELPLPPQPVPERLALDERHGEPELARGLARVVDGQDVGMLEAGGELDLALEPVGPERGGQLRQEDLQGHRPVVLEVLGQEHRGHAPAPELPLERVAPAQPALELRPEIGHLVPMTEGKYGSASPLAYSPHAAGGRGGAYRSPGPMCRSGKGASACGADDSSHASVAAGPAEASARTHLLEPGAHFLGVHAVAHSELIFALRVLQSLAQAAINQERLVCVLCQFRGWGLGLRFRHRSLDLILSRLRDR